MLLAMSTPEISESQVGSLAVIQALTPWRKQLATGFGTTHGNASLSLIDATMVMLAAFYNPVVRSQRMLEALSQQTWMQEKVAIKRIARSTFSDALKRFDPATLKPLIAQLVKRVPALATRDPDLADITRRIVAADGSYFTLAGDVLWALQHRAGGRRRVSTVRLNLQVDVETFVPVQADISGREEGSETQAFQRQLQSGVIYLLDRNFTNWGFLQAVLDADSNFVVRIRKDVLFAVTEPRPLVDKDQQVGVKEDALGHLTGPQSRGNEGRCRQGPPPARRLRRVIVWDPVNREHVMLLTDLVDLPAHVIAHLYRQRWQIELFLRWLKCWAGLEHLISQSPQGITFQFYVAVIGTLLLHIATGRKVSKYAMFWLHAVATGQATWEQMQAGLARIEREKHLEKARLARQKATATKAPAARPV